MIRSIVLWNLTLFLVAVSLPLSVIANPVGELEDIVDLESILPSGWEKYKKSEEFFTVPNDEDMLADEKVAAHNYEAVPLPLQQQQQQPSSSPDKVARIAGLLLRRSGIRDFRDFTYPFVLKRSDSTTRESRYRLLSMVLKRLANELESIGQEPHSEN